MNKKFFKNAMLVVTLSAGIFNFTNVALAENSLSSEAEIKAGLEKIGGAIFPIGEPNDALGNR